MEQATNVSPISQETDDVNALQNIFARAATAITDASRLKQEVQELAKQVEGLRAEVEDMRAQNHWLNEQIADLRTKRDQLQEEYNGLHSQHVQLQQDHDWLRRQHDELQAHHAEVKNERDEHHFRTLDLEEKLKQAQAEIAAYKATLERVSKLVGEVQQASNVVPIQTRNPETGQFEPYRPFPSSGGLPSGDTEQTGTGW